MPVGTIAVEIGEKGWAETSPSALELRILKCPDNVSASWPTIEQETKEDAKLSGRRKWMAELVFIVTEGSMTAPSPARKTDFPQTYIYSKKVDWPGIPSGGCLWADDERGLRTAGLYLPLPGIAHIRRYFPGTANITIRATYRLSSQDGNFTMATILVAARFQPESVLDYNYFEVNTHLFTTQPPATWSEGQQFGKERKKRTARRRLLFPSFPSAADDGDDDKD
jgi:hypothetical protein